jgi:hypothetical protein
MTKIAASGSKIRIRIHQSEAWIRGSGSGSTPICHGSGTLLPYIVGEAVFAAIPTVSTVLLTTVGNAGDVWSLRPRTSALEGVVFFSLSRTWLETECKTPVEYGPQYISTPPPTVSHTLSVYTVHGEGEGGQREGTVEGQHSTVHKYSSSPSMGGNSSQAGSKIQTIS